ncbi:hypothetical protein GGS23DRAFT_167118 [Durotheca rogersii]|uniref:uncharacterized protein n=1 Tax=Durotheca rogersii TaxID=419775 RepID=UPI002220A34A|nr:uncharacterized protein GGS23DRAFT_167118 [Durotheca rogersii]KAI5867232.1 hypothetical protein GGS23DRAFT_167118 [Durotheca rogersii]
MPTLSSLAIPVSTSVFPLLSPSARACSGKRLPSAANMSKQKPGHDVAMAPDAAVAAGVVGGYGAPRRGRRGRRGGGGGTVRSGPAGDQSSKASMYALTHG